MNGTRLIEGSRHRLSSRTLVALAALVGPSGPACRRGAAGASSAQAGSAPGPRAEPIESAGVWGGLKVRTVGERLRPRQIVILLHGWGAPGSDLVPLGPVLAAPGRLFVFPEGPLVSPGGGRAWWHIDMERLMTARQAGGSGERALRRETPPGLLEARAQIAALLGEIARRTGVPASGIVIGGFSQGAMLATDAALSSPAAVGGLAILSGSLVAEETWKESLRTDHAVAPVFMSHGTGDPVLPFPIAEALLGLLRGAGRDVTWVPFAGGHEIPGPVLAGLQSFLGRLTTPSPGSPAAP